MSEQVSLPRPDATLMYAEAGETAAVLERQLAANDTIVSALAESLRAEPPKFVVTCARGSSDHAAMFAKYAIETQLGLVTASASPSIESVYAVAQQLSGALYIVISQSGKSPDLVRNAEAAQAAGARVVALVNVEDSPLAQLADTVIPLRAGPEKSVAATKSYLSTLGAIVHLVARWTGHAPLMEALKATPAALREAFAADWSPLVEGLKDARNLFVLGRGFGFAAALEMALKFKETSGLHAEAFSSAEVQHGPMAIVGEGFPVVAVGQKDATLAGTQDTVNAFRARGAKVFSALPGDSGAGVLPVVAAPHPLIAPLLAVQSFYRAVNALALARGHNPDVPPHLHKVTETV